MSSEAEGAGPTWQGDGTFCGAPLGGRELHTQVGRARASFGLRFGRQDNGSEAAGFLPGDGEKASGLLGTLAEELHGYSRKKGGFSFRFGRG